MSAARRFVPTANGFDAVYPVKLGVKAASTVRGLVKRMGGVIVVAGFTGGVVMVMKLSCVLASSVI